jgi:hypothetical protein
MTDQIEDITVAGRFHGPPTMGHGGYVAGLFAARTEGPVQVTLRRPTPLDAPLQMVELGEGRLELRDLDGEVIAQSEPTSFELDVPTGPTLDVARTAEVGSPSHIEGRGIHGQCFGCGNRAEGEGIRVFAGPTVVDGTAMVAGTWRPTDEMRADDGTVATEWVLAALDCPGAFAFIVGETRAGLLGRIQFEQLHPVDADAEHVVIGWQIGEDGRKKFAGTAALDADGTVLARALATWF